MRDVNLYGELHRFLPVLAHYEGYRIAELPVNHRPREHGRSRYGLERYLRGFLDLLTVSFMGRYRHRPLHLFGGLGLLLGVAGTAILVYMTVLKLAGEAIGHRPLLTLGVLLVVVGMQFFSLGLISELLTSQHEQRPGGRASVRTRTSTRSSPEGSLLRDVRARLPAQPAGDARCLRRAGVEVVERHEPVWERRGHWSAGARRGAQPPRGGSAPRAARGSATTPSSSATRATST